MAFWRKDDKAKKKAERAAAAASASFEDAQATQKRQREAGDAARLSRLEFQGRGFRPIFTRTAYAEPITNQTFQSTALGGGDTDNVRRVSMLGDKERTRGIKLGGGSGGND